jgi:hemoglobin-like flavoprotein
MGTGASHSSGVAPHEMAHKLKRSEAEIVQLMMPVYYTDEKVSAVDLEKANNVWNMIINDTAPNYLALIEKGQTEFGSCMMFFYDTFYSRLFDVHPLCRSMFKSGLKTQGKFLVKMISMLISDIDSDPTKFNNTLVKLTETHNDRGVKSIEYGIVGEVMFWTLREVVGREVFDKDAHLAWIRIFSRILSVVVPVAVAYEIKTGGVCQRDRVAAEHTMLHNKLESESAAGSRQGSAKEYS